MEFLPLIKQLEVQFLRMDEDHRLSSYHYMDGLIQEHNHKSEEEQDNMVERLEELF